MNFNHSKKTVFICYAIFCSFSAVSKVPDGFQDLLNYENRTVRFLNLDGSAYGEFDVEANYNSIKANNQATIGSLREYLKYNNVSNDIIEEIIKDFSSGILNDKRCKGKVDNCGFDVEKYSFLYDYETNKVRFLINENSLDKHNSQEEYEYSSNINTSPGLINSFDVYYGNHRSSGDFININNKSILGFPVGYLTSDLTYKNNDDDKISPREVSYSLDYQGNSMSLGYFTDNVNFNSTSFMDSFSKHNNYSLNIGSSFRLLKKDNANYQVISFYSPSNGELLIYKDDNIIKRKNIKQGVGYISYSELPYGKYEIVIEINSGNEKISSAKYQIYNTLDNQLRIGEVDYMLTLGQYKEKQNNDMESKYFEGEQYFNSLFTYKLGDSILAGFGLNVTEKDAAYKLGARIRLPLDYNFDVVASKFKEGAFHKDLSLRNSHFSVNWESLNRMSDNDHYARYLYADREYSRVNVSANWKFLSSIFYLNFSSGKESKNEGYNSYSVRYRSINSMLSTPFYGRSTLDISLGHQYPNNEFTAYANLRIPLNNELSLNTSGYYSSKYRDNLRNNISYSSRGELNSLSYNNNYQVGHSLYSSIENDNKDTSVADLSLTGGIRSNTASANYYAYTDTDGEYNISGQISSNQIFDGRNIKFSNEKSNSYLKVNVVSHNGEYSNYGILTLKRNDRLENREYLKVENKLYPLKDYSSYLVQLDVDSVGLYSRDNLLQDHFTHPGSIIDLNFTPRKINTMVSVFEDIFGNSVDTIDCIGDGCYRVEEVTDGVFSIQTIDGFDYELVNKNNLCIIDHWLRRKGLCIPEQDVFKSEEPLMVKYDNADYYVYLQGVYNLNENIDSYSDNSPYEILIERSINDKKLVYILSRQPLNVTKNNNSSFDKNIITARK